MVRIIRMRSQSVLVGMVLWEEVRRKRSQALIPSVTSMPCAAYMNHRQRKCGGLGLSAILLYSFSLIVCSQPDTWCQKFNESTSKDD